MSGFPVYEAPSWLSTFIGCGMVVLAGLGWCLSAWLGDDSDPEG